jgi:hypothetical protein
LSRIGTGTFQDDLDSDLLTRLTHGGSIALLTGYQPAYLDCENGPRGSSTSSATTTTLIVEQLETLSTIAFVFF